MLARFSPKYTITILLGILVLAGCSEDSAVDAETKLTSEKADAMPDASSGAGATSEDPDWRLKLTKPDLMTFAADANISWHLSTNVGDMTFRLFHDTAPMHTTSTIYLTEKGFYDNLTFHRVIPGFMAQGGDPAGNGSGNPGYRYDGEFSGGRSHDKPGILSMANAGPGTDGSQFFITFQPTPFLDGKHTIFGEITHGAEVLTELEQRGSRSGATSEPLVINTATISR